MMRSLYSGVAGLRTHQTKMDVLGNNIANVNTTSFKSQSITFSDLMYQTTQTASGATETKGGVNARQIGLGAKSGAIATAIEGQGATQTTNNPFDIMITGKAFFVVNNGKENLYTRDGSFYVDGAGNLAMQSNGYFVMGWVAQEDPETGAITVNKNGGLSQLQIMSADNTTYSPASTTAALYSGNLDDNDSNIVSDDGKTVTLEFYDNKGYLYTAKFTIKDTEDENDHLFSVQLTDIIDSEGNSIGSERMKSVRFGNVENFSNDISAEDYTIEVVDGSDPEVAKCYINAGTALFNGSTVPKTGTLSDLMSGKYSKKDYATILSKVYGITDDYVINQGDGTEKIAGLSKDCKYSIDSDGNLTITLKVSDTLPYVDVKPSDGTKDYVRKSNPSTTYYVNESTLKGYVAIDATDEPKQASTLNKATLTDIFEIPEADATKYVDSSKNYKYTFTVDDSGEGSLKIFENIALETATNAKKVDGSTLYAAKDSFPADFATAIVDNATATPITYKSDLSYTFDGINIKVFQTKETAELDTSKTKQFSDANTPISDGSSYSDIQDAVNALITKNDGSTTATVSGLENIKVTDLKTWLAEAIAAESGTDETQKRKATSEQRTIVQNLIVQAEGIVNDSNNNDLKISVVVKETSGTTGLIVKGYGYKTKEEKIYEGAANPAVSKSDNGYTKKTANDVKYVLQNQQDRTVYVLTGEESKFSDISADLLSNVFGKDILTYTSTGIDYKIDITAGGLNISYDKPMTKDIDAQSYYVEPGTDSENPGFVYRSLLKQNAFGKDVNGNEITIPTSGKVQDLLSTSSKPYAGVLNILYGITDSDARAYGTDGTYVINPDKTLTLSTGEKTIQLKFDAATGKIVSAGGNKEDQTVDIQFADENGNFALGNEAFGFQVKNPNDKDELAKLGTIKVDFSTVTNYNTNGSSTIKVVKGDKASLNTGRAVGEMNGVTVSTDGQIYATYSNGQTKLLGQIASAEFANASGLSKEGDNLYASTLNSGEATIQDITTDGGYMNTGVLEMSNVDLSKEFTEMITTQRGFQANSRIITVSDTLLEELTNLKR